MKRPRATSLQLLMQPATVPVPVKAAPKPVVRTIGEASTVVLTHAIHYRSHGDKRNLIRPGHKMIPKGAVGIVKQVVDAGTTFELELRQPIIGRVQVLAQEVRLLEK